MRQRQQQRATQPWTASDATLAVYLEQQQRCEPPQEVPAAARLELDTTRRLAANLDLLEEILAATPGSGTAQRPGH